MASSKLTEDPKKFLKPDQVIVDGDSVESENDNTETVDDDDNYEQLRPAQSLL
jgi:hypothetical protein